MQIHNPATSDLKCPTCLISFQLINDHKDHYKSDFHRYNLKRKMVKLAPATFEQFKAKKLQSQPQKQEDHKCNQCGKKFASAKTFEQHIISKNHNPNIQKQAQGQKSKKPKSAPAFQKNNKICIFCLALFPNFSENLRHMQSSHSFFIPQPNYCIDQAGLIEYLQQKVQVGFLCITCENKNAKDFNSGEAVRKHMLDKGHVFVKNDEGYDEYLKFYDFSSQFKEIVDQQKDRYVPGIQYTTLKVVVKEDSNKMQGEDDWEDDSSSSEQQREDKKEKEEKDQNQWESESSNGQEEQIVQKEIEKKKDRVKTYHIMRPTETANGQLLLPNGKVLGHRKYRYLYRQNYRNPIWLNQNIKALGYDSSSNALITKQRLIQLVKQEKLLYRAKHRWNKRQLSDGMQNNLLQKYYRSRNSL